MDTPNDTNLTWMDLFTLERKILVDIPDDDNDTENYFLFDELILDIMFETYRYSQSYSDEEKAANTATKMTTY